MADLARDLTLACWLHADTFSLAAVYRLITPVMIRKERSLVPLVTIRWVC